MNVRQSTVILAMLLAGLLLAALILSLEPAGTGHEDHHEEAVEEEHFPRGPHGGRLLSRDDFALEVTIYEAGVEPRFRVYAYDEGELLPPEEVELEVVLERLGGRREAIAFHGEADYLLGETVVKEPHSFKVDATAEHAGKTHRFAYVQEEGRVMLPAESLKSAGIEIKTAGPADIETVVELPGEIRFDQSRLAHVVPRVAGVAVEVPAKLGDRVDRGDVIAVLESRELADLKSRYATAMKRLKLARELYQRETRLWQEKISPEQDYLTARTRFAEAEIAAAAAREQLTALGLGSADLQRIGAGAVASFSRYELKAPLAGTVIEKHAVTGEAVQADSTVFVVADLSGVWVEFSVPAKDLNRVRLGQAVRVKSESLGLEAQAPISYLGALLGEQTRSAPAHVHLPNSHGHWRAGLFVTVEVVQAAASVPVAVAAEAVQTWRDFDVVFVRYGDHFEVRPLKLGRRDGEWAEVLGGLSPGERYAARNSFVLKAELGKAGATHQH